MNHPSSHPPTITPMWEVEFYNLREDGTLELDHNDFYEMLELAASDAHGRLMIITGHR